MQRVIPASCQKLILEKFHDENCHVGIPKTIGSILEKYWWPQVADDVNAWTKTCKICQRSKIPSAHINVLLKPIDVMEPWETVVVDCCKFPESNKGNIKLVIF